MPREHKHPDNRHTTMTTFKTREGRGREGERERERENFVAGDKTVGWYFSRFW